MEVLVKIDSLSFGGFGIGRISGKVVFVPYSAPGDNLKVRITKDAKGYAEADIVEVSSPSPLRKEPVCALHSICGGCHWLHLPYEVQVKAKEEIFKDTLKRIGRMDPSIVKPAKPSPAEFHYRSRVQFKVSGKKIGFYKRESHDLVEIVECPLAHPLINRILNGLRNLYPSFSPSATRVDINISPSSGKGIVSIYLNERANFNHDQFYRELNHSINEVTGLVIHYKKEQDVSGSQYLFSEEEGFMFRASEGSFSQVNHNQNLNMKEYILSLAELKGNEAVLELYSGGGNFTIPIADRAEKVIGVEVGKSSVSDAKENARVNNIKNATFIQATAERGLKEIQNYKLETKNFGLVLVDPPRDGCSKEVIEGIVSLKPKKIIYVSCNPSTLARDLDRFKSLGYATMSSKPFDMFPQTYHIESVTELLIS